MIRKMAGHCNVEVIVNIAKDTVNSRYGMSSENFQTRSGVKELKERNYVLCKALERRIGYMLIKCNEAEHKISLFSTVHDFTS